MSTTNYAKIAEWIAKALPILQSELVSKVEQKIDGDVITAYRTGAVIRVDLKLGNGAGEGR
jgi:hypothetical protein